MEQSPADPSNELTLDEVVRIYGRWFRSAPRGFALLVYQGESARREVLNKLGGKVKGLRFIDLSACKDAQAVIESMTSALEAADRVIFFGFEEALAATAENARLLNFNRERLANFRARQLWVVGPRWRRNLLTSAYDLYSWFLPNNTIGFETSNQPSGEKHRSKLVARQVPGPASSQAARSSARSLLNRFERVYRDQDDVHWSLLSSALNSMRLAGSYPDTEELLKRADKLVSEIGSSVNNQSPSAQRELAASLIQIGFVYDDLGKVEDALGRYKEAVEINRRLADIHRESHQPLLDLAASLINAGIALRDLGLKDEALQTSEEALAVSRKVLMDYGESQGALRGLAKALDLSGTVGRDFNLVPEAYQSFREALEISDKLVDAYGESPQSLHDLAASLSKVGNMQVDLRRLDEALSSYEQTLQICRKLIDINGETAQTLRAYSVSLEKVADVEWELGRKTEALSRCEESLVVTRKILESFGESPLVLRDLSVSLERVGDIQIAIGQSQKALVPFEEALGIRRRLLHDLGESPRTLRDIALMSGSIALLSGVSTREGLDALVEGKQAVERAIQLYGEFKEFTEVLQWLESID